MCQTIRKIHVTCKFLFNVQLAISFHVLCTLYYPHNFIHLMFVMLIIMSCSHVSLPFVVEVSLEEKANMPTCNLFEIIHNIWLQQQWKRGKCLYIATYNNYLWAFRHSYLYWTYLHGGLSRKGLDRNELWIHLHKVSEFDDSVQWIVISAIFLLVYSFTFWMLRLEDEEVFSQTRGKFANKVWKGFAQAWSC